MEVLFIDTLAVTLGNEMGFLFALKQVPVIIKKTTFFIVRYCLSSTPFMSFFLLLIVRSLTHCDLRCYVLRVPLIFIYNMCYFTLTHSAIPYILSISLYLVPCYLSICILSSYSMSTIYFLISICTAYSL